MMDQDAEHLRLLSIFHYVVAGIGFMFSLFPGLYLVFGIFMVTGRLPASGQEPPPEWFGWVFVALGLVFIILVWAFSICLVLAGRFLARRRHHVFCLVIGALACTFMPFGTVLGVFTLIVLSRASVRRLFEPAPPVVNPS